MEINRDVLDYAKKLGCTNVACACTGACREIKTLEYKPLQFPENMPQLSKPSISVARGLKLCRKLKGYSLRDVEEVTGISNAYLSQIETGKIQDPSFNTIIKLCMFYQISVDDLC